jgi:glycosyltransferase involved in cell wall biosynthesis
LRHRSPPCLEADIPIGPLRRLSTGAASPLPPLASASLRLALLSDWYAPRLGGLELHLQDLARRLRGAGHDVVVITPTPGPTEVDGVSVTRIGARRLPGAGVVYTRQALQQIGDALSEACVDVVHCHVSIVSPAALGGAAQAQARGIPTAITFHSYVPRTRILAGAMRLALGTDAWPVCFTAVSNRVAREVRPIADGKPMSILPNGIDVGFWRIPQRPRGRPTVELLSVMRLNPKKRPLALPAIMSRVMHMLTTDVDVRLRIVGDGPERRALQREINRRRLRDRVELLGSCTRAQIRDLLAETDVFVLPTVRESFGLAALEARCTGVPVVAMAGSGVAELIDNGRGGLLARSDGEMAMQVLTLIRDPCRRHAMAQHNRDSTPPHDWADVIGAHEAIYREAIALRASV